MFKFKSFIEHVRSRDEGSSSHKKSAAKSSKSRQHVVEEPPFEHRPSKRSSRGSTSKVTKRRSSSNLSRSRLDLVKVAAESQILPPRLDPVPEETEEIDVRDSLTWKKRLPSQQSPKASKEHVHQNKTSEYLSPDLMQELLHLREENAALKARLADREESPAKNGIPARDSAQWEEQSRTLEEQNRTLEEQSQTLEEQSQTLEEQSQTLEEQSRNLEEQSRTLEELRQQYATIREDLKREKAKFKEAERSRNRMAKQLAASTRVEPSLYDDAHFTDSVHELRWQVYNWVKNIRWEIPNRSRSRNFVVPTIYKFLKITSPSFQDFLISRKGIELLIQGHVWQYLIREVFCQPCFWAETRDKSVAEQDISNNPFSLLRSYLRKEISYKHEADFQEWRVSSVRLLAKRDQRLVDQDISFAAKTVMAPLVQDFKPIQSGDPHLRSLENIFRSAINLDYLMQQQRADYVFFPTLTWGGFVTFNDEKYIYPDEDDKIEVVSGKTQVRLVVEPSFCRFGDSNGSNYDKDVCLLKGEVEV